MGRTFRAASFFGELMHKPLVPLGRTGISITPVGLGCWQFAGGKGLAGGYWRGLPQQDVDAIIAEALGKGISWFDTAEAYGMGKSERSLGAALQASGVKPGDVVLATKWMPVMRTSRSITKTYPAREAALSPYRIDLHQVHNPAGFSSVHREMEVMADLVDQGRLRAVGVSNFGAERMKAAHRVLEGRGLSLASNQVRYSLLDRKIERNGVLEAARELGVTIIAYSPLSQGLLTGRFHDDPGSVKDLHGPRRYLPRFQARALRKTLPLIEELRKVAATNTATPAQVSLAWLVQKNPGLVVVIPGASSVSQAGSSAGAMSVELDADDIERLDRVSREVLLT
jgi:aryl-alcohol dehydrogenase-like predicted oxidoreductase